MTILTTACVYMYTPTNFSCNHIVAVENSSFKAYRSLGKMCVGRRGSFLPPCFFSEPKQPSWGVMCILSQPRMLRILHVQLQLCQ